MRELNTCEIEEVNGGIIPLIIAIVSIDVGLIASMFVVQSAMGKK
ncbi:MAG: class IIb bacteriocin, lactobin A/cerein 7B family [Aliivibrio sp.]|nr:class IIb bacteriocin, lactobin A/cerein 7B family [Aliivibrio sp.]